MEGYGPESYGDGIADVYDEWYADLAGTDECIAALLALTQRFGATRVLELGIGSGRLALPLAAEELEVWGIDASHAMVERLRGKPDGAGIRVAVGDMAELDLSALPGGSQARFGLVYVAINTFFNLTTAAAQQRCLQRVREVLEPGGVFVLEAFVPDLDRPTNVVEARTVELDHVILAATRHDPVEQIVRCQYIEIRESGIRMHPLVVRYAPPAELDAMAALAGLRLIERWSDWRGSPFTDEAILHVSVYATA
jgi:SAM-dependent methyltransferase